MSERVYTVKQVAEILSVHRDTVYDWIKQGRLGFVRPTERTTRVRQAHLDEFLAGNTYDADVA